MSDSEDDPVLQEMQAQLSELVQKIKKYKLEVENRVVIMDVILPTTFYFSQLKNCPHIRNVDDFKDMKFVHSKAGVYIDNFKYYLCENSFVYIVKDTFLKKLKDEKNKVKWNNTNTKANQQKNSGVMEIEIHEPIKFIEISSPKIKNASELPKFAHTTMGLFIYQDKYYLCANQCVYIIIKGKLLPFFEDGKKIRWKTTLQVSNEPFVWHLKKFHFMEMMPITREHFNPPINNFETYEDFTFAHRTHANGNIELYIFENKKTNISGFLCSDGGIYTYDDNHNLAPIICNGRLQRWDFN